MAKFYGQVGYVEVVETSPGIYKEIEHARDYYGDVLQGTRRLEPGEYLNDDIRVSNSISIVSDAYAMEHIFAMRYIRWMGSKWKVVSVDVQRPRLILTIGGLYNG